MLICGFFVLLIGDLIMWSCVWCRVVVVEELEDSVL